MSNMFCTSTESGEQWIALRRYYFSVERDSFAPEEITLTGQEFLLLFIPILVMIKKKSTQKQLEIS